MYKLGRTYVLQVGELLNNIYTGINLIITPPITVEFDITRNTLTSANVCQIRIYNLSSLNRNFLRHNEYNFGIYQPIIFMAGYTGVAGATGLSITSLAGGALPVIFSGNVSRAWSVREGVNFITQIECYDGGFAFNNATTNLTFPPGTPQTAVIAALTATLPNVKPGAIGVYPNVSARSAAYSGNTIDILREITGGGFFIDNGKGNALNTNEVIVSPSGIALIDPSAGLLNTPVLQQNLLRFDMEFEPNLQVGQQIILDSFTEPSLNGTYKVTGIKHRGIISGAVCGEAVTTVEMLYNAAPVPVVSSG